MEVLGGWLCGWRGLDSGVLRPRVASLRGRPLAGVAGLSGLSGSRSAARRMTDRSMVVLMGIAGVVLIGFGALLDRFYCDYRRAQDMNSPTKPWRTGSSPRAR